MGRSQADTAVEEILDVAVAATLRARGSAGGGGRGAATRRGWPRW